MASILPVLDTEYKTEYSVKKYSKPKIYHGGENYDLSKRWYVYYSYRDPSTGKMERQPPVYDNINRDYSEKTERLKAVRELQKAVSRALKRGFSPYKDEFHGRHYYAESAIDFALKIKKNEVTKTTYWDYDLKLKYFKKYLKSKGIRTIDEVSKRVVSDFLDQFGAKNSNNYRAAISAVFSVLSHKDIIVTNFVKELRQKKIRKKATRIYTEKEVENIIRLLEKQDAALLLFIKLVSYMFWRPVEIMRIKIQNIDLDRRLMKSDTKSKDDKTKIIPEIIYQDIIDFIGDRKSGYLFEGYTGDDNARRNAISRRFSRFRDRNGMDKEFQIYSFRHTYITKMYLELRKKLSIEDTIKQLSLITGHESKAIFVYIQTNDIELPEDYSDLL